MIEIKFKKLHPLAILPKSWSDHAIGLDIHACIPGEGNKTTTSFVYPGETKPIRTWLAIEPPEGYFIFVCSRSGLAKSAGIFIANSPGLIDPDFRGEILVLLYNSGFSPYRVSHADRIGQIVVLPAISAIAREVEELSASLRGTQGFGSTGQ